MKIFMIIMLRHFDLAPAPSLTGEVRMPPDNPHSLATMRPKEDMTVSLMQRSDVGLRA